ncbi:MAG: hypothetical protein OHK0056_26150 [Bacteriovoracaceae bacterium]
MVVAKNKNAKSFQEAPEKTSMNKDKCIKSSDIIFFEGRLWPKMTDLKVFIHFLSSQGIARPFKFSFVESQALLLPNISLIENILLDTRSINHSKDSKASLELMLESKSNPFLKELAKEIQDLDCLPAKATAEQVKLTGIIKGMLNASDYMLFSKPELYLSEENTRTLIKAINIECHTHKRMALISSCESNTWLPHISKQVVKNEKNEFIIRPMLKIAPNHLGPKAAGHLEIRSLQLNQKKVA